MAAIPDQGMPGDDLPAQPAQADLLNAYSAGYTHDDVAEAIGTEPPRPDITEIWGGTHPADATWSQPTDPTQLDTPEQASVLIHQMAESGLGIGAVEGVGVRAAALGVKTTVEELGTQVAGPATIEASSAGDIARAVIGNKWTRRAGAAIGAGEATYDIGKKSGKE